MRLLLRFLVPKRVAALAEKLDKKSLSWSGPYTRKSPGASTGQAPIADSRPTLPRPDPVRLSARGPSSLESMQSGEDSPGETPKSGIFKSVSCSSNWSSDNEEKGTAQVLSTWPLAVDTASLQSLSRMPRNGLHDGASLS